MDPGSEFIVGLIMVLSGLLHVFLPQVTWFLSIGWKIQDAEPSEAYMTFTRIGGGAVAVIGMALIIAAFVQTGVQQAHAMDDWNTFQREMTAQNVLSIDVDDSTSGGHLNRQQIQQVVRDVHAATAQPYDASREGGFSAAESFTIRCQDGYQAELIVGSDGTLGIAQGPGWLTPEYEFTSDDLSQLLSSWIPAS